jgi:hypothetical protein
VAGAIKNLTPMIQKPSAYDINLSGTEVFNVSSSNNLRTHLVNTNDHPHPALGAIDTTINGSIRNLKLISAINNQLEEQK